MNGDSVSARVDGGLTDLTSFGIIAEPSAPENPIGNAQVNNGAEAPKSHLPPMEVRMQSSAACGLLPTGTASIATRTIFLPPPPSWILGDKTKKRTSRTNFNQFAFPCWRKVLEKKSRQTLAFDPGGCTDRLRVCPFL